MVLRHGGGPLRGTQAPLRGHRRGGHERPRAGGPRARGGGVRLGPRGVPLLGAACARPASSHAIGHDAAHVPAGAEGGRPPPSPPDNPELALRRASAGRASLHRGDLLGEVTALRRTIAVAGTHGKTTTTSHGRPSRCSRRGRDPAYPDRRRAARRRARNAAWGAGEWAVVEADESDRSFLKLDARGRGGHQRRARPPRHLPIALRGRRRAFAEFAAPAGLLVLGRRHAPAPAGRRRVSYGIDEGDLRAEDVELRRARLALHGGRACRFELRGARASQRAERPGGARGLPRRRGSSRSEAAPALAALHRRGAALRAITAATASGARVFDDYAHHPTEVRATLEAARTLAPERLVACLPAPSLLAHAGSSRASSARALALADLVVVLDVYPARERAEDFPGVSGLTGGAARRRRRRRAAGVVAARLGRRRARARARSCARATCC